ncbi:HAD family phosphatase [Dysgonomonas sp. BGC7]|uniref:HAD family hydrolase n=1 Tax=Dysgonomonas sp. BGC7 TaxID=1658008 RepID=UPI0006821B44|nr:HAD family phosphatase [Dysgonomonas sp. BGC7]MBD8388487.1 HAD family phosphatase [Dysgonomonas sp. BGC7]
MTKISTILFDFDGVIANTEPQYDIYIDALGKEYNLGIENFALQVKGTTTPNLIKNHFSHLSEAEQEKIKKDLDDFEQKMEFPLVDGVLNFISYLKENHYKIGLVTSSQELKMKRALEILNLDDTFDTIVTAARITQGKPNPMCYLLAAEDLGVPPSECLVFEDSFHGARSGRDAGMQVVGVTTTIPRKDLKDKTDYIIDDFSDINYLTSLFK